MQNFDLNHLVRVPKSALIEHCERGGEGREGEERQWVVPVVRRRVAPSLDRPLLLLSSLFGRSLISVIEGVTETNKWDDGDGDIEPERAPRRTH